MDPGTLSAQQRRKPAAQLLNPWNGIAFPPSLSLTCRSHMSARGLLPRAGFLAGDEPANFAHKWPWMLPISSLSPVPIKALPLLSSFPLFPLCITPPGHRHLSPEPAGTSGHSCSNPAPSVNSAPSHLSWFRQQICHRGRGMAVCGRGWTRRSDPGRW
jgi:hypothetical protein